MTAVAQGVVSLKPDNNYGAITAGLTSGNLRLLASETSSIIFMEESLRFIDSSSEAKREEDRFPQGALSVRGHAGEVER